MANRLLEDIKAQGTQSTTTNRLLQDIQARGIPISAPPASITQEKVGFFQGVKNIVKRRSDILSEGYLAQMQGKQTFGESALQTAGQTLTGAFEIGMKGAGSILSAVTPDFIENPIKKYVKGAFQNVLETPLGQMAINTAKVGAEKYAEFKQANPRIARDVEAVLNIAAFFPVGKGAKIAGEEAGKVLGGVVKEAGALAKTGLEKLGSGTTKGIKFAVAQASGLSPKTITNIVDETLLNPKAFTKSEMAAITKESLGQRVFEGISKKLDDISDLGKEYNALRASTAKTVVPENFFQKILKSRFKVFLDETGKIIQTKASKPMTSADVNALEGFIKTYGTGGTFTAEEFLNTREALSNLAYNALGSGKSTASGNIASILRAELNKIARPSIKGLAKLDEKFKPMKAELKQILKDYVNKQTGELKDNALSKIANLTKEGRQPVLARLKQVVPDIERQINILNSIEDIKYAAGQKVGAYGRSILGIGGGFAAGGIPGALIGSILTNPYLALAILRQYGLLKRALKPFITNLIAKMEKGIKLTKAELGILNQAVIEISQKLETKAKGLSAGLSIKNISGGIDEVKNIPWVRGEGSNLGGKSGDKFFSTSEYIAGDYGKVRKILSEEMPKNPLIMGDKQELADLIGYKGDPFAEKLNTKNNFDDLAKSYAEKEGYDGIMYRTGTFEKPELHIFSPKTSPQNASISPKMASRGPLEAKAGAYEPVSKKEPNLTKKSTIINPDILKAEANDFNPANHEIYSAKAKEMYSKALKENKNPIVKFTMGGSGSGKSEILIPHLSKKFDGIIFDGTGSNYENFVGKFKQAMNAGKQVEISAILPDIETAWKFVQKRYARSGRPVLLKEFLRMHEGFIDTLKKVITNFPDIKTKLFDARGLLNKKFSVLSKKENILKTLNNVHYNLPQLEKKFSKMTPQKVILRDLRDNVDKVVADINSGGVTYDVMKNKGFGGQHYTAVSVYPERSKVFTGKLKTKDIISYVKDNLDLLSQKNHTLGGWYDTESKKLWLDVAAVVKDTKKAVSLGKQFNQKAVFNLKSFKEIPTGGTGEVMKNILSIEERKNLIKGINL